MKLSKEASKQIIADLSDRDYVFISYFLLYYILSHGGVLYRKRFMEEFNVPEWKFKQALRLLKEKGLIQKGRGRDVKLTEPFSLLIWREPTC